MFLSCGPQTSITIKSLKCVVLVIGLAVFINVVGHSYPENFDQPIKYQLISAGTELITYFGHVLEYFDLGHRLYLTRFGFHWTIGAFNIRDPKDGIKIIDEDLEHLSMRIFRPMNQTDMTMPTIIFYHGGGYFIGSKDVNEPIAYLLAKATNYQVIYIEYRLIPEHKYPAAFTDSLLVTKHLIKNSHQYRINLTNVIFMGDSAGGNLATVISQKIISEKICTPRLQVLIYPILQLFDFTLPSYRMYMGKRVLGNIHHENFKNFLHYLTGIPVDDTVFQNGHTSGLQKESIFAEYVNPNLLPTKVRNHKLGPIKQVNDTKGQYSQLTDIILSKELSPLLVDDDYLKSFTPPNTFIVTVEMDILRDDGFIYAERLRRNGLNIRHKHYDNLFHGVLNLIHGPLEISQSRVLLNDIAHAIKNVL